MTWGVSLWVYPVWDSLIFFNLSGSFLPHFREFFFTIVSLNIFSGPFLWYSSSGTLTVWMLGHWTLSQRSLRLSSFLWILFFFVSSSMFHLFPPFYLPPHLSSIQPQFFYCWLPPEYFWSQLLHYSLLIDSSLQDLLELTP